MWTWQLTILMEYLKEKQGEHYGDVGKRYGASHRDPDRGSILP